MDSDIGLYQLVLNRALLSYTKNDERFYAVINELIQKARENNIILVESRSKKYIKRILPVKNRKNVIRIINSNNKRVICPAKRMYDFKFNKAETWDIIDDDTLFEFKLKRMGIN